MIARLIPVNGQPGLYQRFQSDLKTEGFEGEIASD